MAKNPSHLTLVRKAGQEDSTNAGRSGNTFEIVALSDLGVAEQKRIEKTVAALVPSAPIIGVQVTARPWDIRPVVMASREGVPSLLRFVGPEVTLASNIATRIQESFERISAFDNLARASLMNEWGLYDGQLWYRRPVVEMTLAQAIANGEFTELADVLSLARGIISKIEEFHSRGVAHGHLILSNIFYSPYGEISFLDAGVGLAISQAAITLGFDTSPRGYPRQSFAPETLNTESVVLSSDVYGLGLVLQGIFARFADPARAANNMPVGQRPRNQLTIMLDAFVQMSDENPTKRPSLAAVKELFGNRATGMDEVTSIPSSAGARPEDPAVSSQGRIVKVRRNSQGGRGSGSFPLIPPVEESRVEKPMRRELTPDVVTESVAPDVQRKSTTPASYIQHVETSAPPAPRESSNRVLRDSVPPEPEHEFVEHPEEHYEEHQEDELPPRNKLSNGALLLMVAIVTLVVGGLFYTRTQRELPQYSQQELELWWMSKRPSMMSNVALAAVDRESPDKFAEMLIVSTAMRGETVGAGVDGFLIRVAFDERWERDLKDADRRLALALALSSLLREKTPRDLPPLESAHPGVILSITASAGENVGAILDKIPVTVLGELPPPLGPAFLELGRHSQNLTCGDETTRSFARLATRGVEDSEQLMSFVSRDTSARLRAVAILYSTDSVAARRVLDVLLNHPNIELDHELIKWAKSWNLLTWEEMENSSQLALLGGIPPSGNVSVQNLGKLFSHPQPSIRGFAIKEAVDEIKFSHPGAYVVLKAVAEQPEVLSPAQTVQLAQLLESYTRASGATVRAWLETHPPKEIVAALLVSASGERQESTMDFEFSRYLQNLGWEPKLKDLEKLIFHPDNLTRFFAYTKVYAISDTMVSRELLNDALVKEKDPEFRKRLELMVSSLG